MVRPLFYLKLKACRMQFFSRNSPLHLRRYFIGLFYLLLTPCLWMGCVNNPSLNRGQKAYNSEEDPLRRSSNRSFKKNDKTLGGSFNPNFPSSPRVSSALSSTGSSGDYNIPRLTQFSNTEDFSSGVYMLGKEGQPCQVKEGGSVPYYHVKTQSDRHRAFARFLKKKARRSCRRADLAPRGAFASYPDVSLFFEEFQLTGGTPVAPDLTYGQIPSHVFFGLRSGARDEVFMVGHSRRPCQVSPKLAASRPVFTKDLTDGPIASFLRKHSVGPCNKKDYRRL